MACGPVTARDIVMQLGIFGYAKVLCDIRRRLAGTGVTVKARPVNGRRNFWEYRLATSDSSKPPSGWPGAAIGEDRAQ